MKCRLLYEQFIEAASGLAAFAHTGQKYGDKDYYAHHVVGVYERCKAHKEHEGVIWEILGTVALLHDVLEDSFVSYATLQLSFGTVTADSIMLLTRKDQVSKEQYLKSIVDNKEALPYAWIVKVEDTKFNLLSNIAESDVEGIKKYSNQLAILLG